MHARIDSVLAQIGLWELRGRAPNALSGGEQKRLALAAALAMRPDILLLDEPAGGLDPCGRAEMLAALDMLNGTIVMAESDPEIAARADRVLVLHEGRFRLEGTPDEVFRDVGRLDSIGAPVPPAARLAAQIGADFVTREGALAALRRGAV
jgi:energy-coupling factor transporter ATP-binding protein EcfA2